jgi:DUF917 family protein
MTLPKDDKTLVGDDVMKKLAEAEIEVLKFLGSGGEGKVYLGKITCLDQLVAFKQFQIINSSEKGSLIDPNPLEK